MIYDFDAINNRRGGLSYKYNAVENDVLPLWVADMDFKCAPEITSALNEFVNTGIYGYTSVPDSYYKAYIDWFYKRDGILHQKESLICVPGIVPAISATIKALTLPGDQVIIQSPVYNCFFSSIRNCGCETVDNELFIKNNCHYEMDLEDLEQKLSASRARILLLCNPQNPSGRLWSFDELKNLALICKKHHIYVISDEIHCDVRDENSKFTSMAHFYDLLENRLVIFKSASKAFNLAGLQNACIIARDPFIRERIDRQVNINEICDVNPFGIIGAITAFNKCESWLIQMNKYVKNNYLFLKDFFENNPCGIKVFPLESTYLSWLSIKDLNISSKDFCKKLYKEGRVLLNEGTEYGKGGEGFIRLNLALPKTVLNEALIRILKTAKSI